MSPRRRYHSSRPKSTAYVLRFEQLESRQLLSMTPGNAFMVNSGTTGFSGKPSVASDAAGDYAIAWENGGQVYASLYNSSGGLVRGEFLVSTNTNQSTDDAQVAMDSAGDFVVTWVNGDDAPENGVAAQRYDKNGNAVGGVIQVVPLQTDALYSAQVVMDAAGDFVVTYEGPAPFSEYGLYAKLYNASGDEIGSQIGISSSLDHALAASVAMDPQGDFVVAYYRYYYDGVTDTPVNAVYFRQFNSQGVGEGSAVQVNPTTTLGASAPAVAVDSDGDFMVAFDGSQVVGGQKQNGVYAQLFDSSRNPIGGETDVSSYVNGSTLHASQPMVSADSNGDFVVGWNQSDNNNDSTVVAQLYTSAGQTESSQFQVESQTHVNDSNAVAMDSTGDFVVVWGGYTYAGHEIGSTGLFWWESVYGRRYTGTPGAPTLTLGGDSSSGNTSITFTDATDFTITSGGTTTSYTTSDYGKIVYNAPSGFSQLVFDDPNHTYDATQSFDSTKLVGNGFDLTANGVTNLYIYGASGSTATINVGSGSESNFFVDDTAASPNYSYIGNPATGGYSELSGFSSETITGSGGTTYAYIYSTSHAATVADPTQTTFTLGSVTTKLANFPQVYVVGAADGTDTVQLDSDGGTFVGTPSFSYTAGTANGSNFLMAALYAANVTGNPAGASDTAVFYSYPNDTFNGSGGPSSLSGSAPNLLGSMFNFVTAASNYAAVSVFESGAGTDSVTLNTAGLGSVYSTSTATSVTIGSYSITVNTYFVSNGQTVPIAGQIVVNGSGGSATLVDSPGSNALVASGSMAKLTTAFGSITVNGYDSVTAVKQNGSSDTVHQDAIDFFLSADGWTMA